MNPHPDKTSLPGLRVLDFSRVLAGPVATMMLGDLGADVVKVERPGVGDETRSWGPPYDQQGDATYFQAVNRNKRSVILDLDDDRDLARARELAKGADVLVENFRAGLLDDRGLGYGHLRSENPRLIYCSITGFGRGAGAGLAGYDLLVQALGGLMSITGPADGEPQKVGVALVDVLAGLFAVTGILAALHARRESGRGQRVEVSLLGALLASLVNQASAYTIGGLVPKRMGNAHPSIAPYELYRASDRHLVVAVGNDRQFAALCNAIGTPQLAEDDRFRTNSDRVEHRQLLREEMEQRFGTEGAAHWVQRLQEARVPAGVVNDIAEAIELARSLELDPVVTLPRDDGSQANLIRNPIVLSETPISYRSAPPRFPRLGSSAPE